MLISVNGRYSIEAQHASPMFPAPNAAAGEACKTSKPSITRNNPDMGSLVAVAILNQWSPGPREGPWPEVSLAAE